MNPKPRCRCIPLAGAALVAAVLAACATTTPYQPLSKGVGYQEQKLESNRYRVSFQGSSWTSRETVENYLLYRIAELTLANGYDYFTVTTQATEQELEDTGPRVGVSFGHFGFGRHGGFGIGLGTGSHIRTEYQGTADVMMFRGTKPKDDPRAYDAREVKTNLEPTITRPQA